MIKHVTTHNIIPAADRQDRKNRRATGISEPRNALMKHLTTTAMRTELGRWL